MASRSVLEERTSWAWDGSNGVLVLYRLSVVFCPLPEKIKYSSLDYIHTYIAWRFSRVLDVPVYLVIISTL